MSSKGVYGSSAGDTDFRRTWNAETVAKKKLEKESKKKPKKKDEEVKEEGPKLLQARTEAVDFTANLNKIQVVSASADPSKQPGFYCDICDILLKDSLAYLDHINGRRHQENMGVEMQVERSTLAQVKARFEVLKRKRNGTAEEQKYDLAQRVAKAAREEQEEKELKKERKKEAKRQNEIEKQAKAMEGVDEDVLAAMGFGGFGSTKQTMKHPTLGELRRGLLRSMYAYFDRSLEYVKKEAISSIEFDIDVKPEMEMMKFNTKQDLEAWTVGCDADIGGKSKAYWGLSEEKTGLFWGTLDTEIPEDAPHITKSGYAGLKSKLHSITLMHRPVYDVSMYRYLAIRARGDSRQWFVNLQTAGSLYATSLYQHRLIFQRPGQWEIVRIPFKEFVLTDHGFVQQKQISLDSERISTVGFSVVQQPGDFMLELDWIKAVNTELPFGKQALLENNSEYSEISTASKKQSPIVFPQ